MTTKETEDFPEIEWEDLKQDLVESDADERMEVYYTTGFDEQGNLYSGSAYFFADIFEEIKDIQLISVPITHKAQSPIEKWKYPFLD